MPSTDSAQVRLSKNRAEVLDQLAAEEQRSKKVVMDRIFDAGVKALYRR